MPCLLLAIKVFPSLSLTVPLGIFELGHFPLYIAAISNICFYGSHSQVWLKLKI